jgi:hypothetical protein
MIAPLCGAPYQRPNGEILTCHYLAEHPTEQHSWWTASTQDTLGDDSVPPIESLLAAIGNGAYDPYLEAILAASHARKRALRGVILPWGLSG